MRRFCIAFFLILIPLVSCTSLGKKDNPVPAESRSENTTLIPRTTGPVNSWNIENDRLVIQGEEPVSIIYDLGKSASKAALNSAETYRYSVRKRPDGPTITLTLYRGNEEILLAFQGIREGAVLNGLEVQAEGENTVLLKSSDREWIIQENKKTLIDWGEGEYTVYVSRIGRGTLADQPPFRCNLILLKK
ncbi:MAG: hypothetical protein PQJ58_22250 [Spirochaetales bacterium]|nr:hypothetical protein [Spirochaetales bacterium]